MVGFLEVVLAVAAVPALLASSYLLGLAAASARPRPPVSASPRLRFDVIVPAHDEEAGIAATVTSLSAVDYPAALRRVIVVADNCTDATATVARAAGAHVIERLDPELRGKGYALALAFERSLAERVADAVVVVDADTIVSRNLLRAFAARLEAGASAVQAHYGVRNPEASWRTRLMEVAFALFHTVRSAARERLGCSVGLRGNGMCFAARVLREVPYDAYSVVEDLEYGIRLGRAGHRVHHAGEAEVWGEMVAGAEGSRSQRLRWEQGRRQMARAHALSLLVAGIRRRDRVLLDLGVDLLVPPLAALGGAVLAGSLAAAAVSFGAGRVILAAWAWWASAGALTLYVLRGWWVSGTGLRGLGGLLHAPIYLVWKVGLALGHRGSGALTWIRTARERRMA